MTDKSPMDIEIIKKNYSRMETEELVKLVNEITSLTPEAILALQYELLKRGKHKFVIKISEYLTSSRFQVSEEKIINYLIVLRKKGLSENEIEIELRDSFSIENDYIEYCKIRLKSKARENITIGIVLILFPLFLIIKSLILGGYIGFGAAIILAVGIWRLIKGINLHRFNLN